MLRFRALVALSLCLFSFTGFAQAPGTGLYALGSFDNRGFDAVNIGNLNVHFQIPIVNKAGRGTGFQYNIVYDGLLWAPSDALGNSYWTPDVGWGFHGQVNGQVVDGFAGHVTYDRTSVRCYTEFPDYYLVTSMSNFEYHDEFGQTHEMNWSYDGCQESFVGDGTSSDGSGYTMIGQLTVADRYGNKRQVPFRGGTNGSMTDTNGNQITANGDGTFTDTLGVIALSITGAANASDPRVFTYNVANQANNATTAAITMSYRTYMIQTNFSCGGIAEYGPTSADLVDRITLADGRFYQFNYEPTPGISGAYTGRFASVTLPTGGTVSYQYLNGCSGAGINSDGTVGSLARVTSDGTRTYGRAPSSNGSITTVQDEAGNQSLYTFTDLNGVFYESHRQVFQGAATGTPLLDLQTCINNSAPCDGALFTLPASTVTSLASYNGGSQQKTITTYDPTAQLISGVQTYDPAGSLLQTAYTNYGGYAQVIAAGIKDGSGNDVSKTTFGYDEQATTPTSGIPQHTAGTNFRNLTSSHAWINTSGTTLDTATSYYDTGVPVSSTDPNGATNYSYDSTQGFVTQVTPPTPSSGVSLPSFASYDVNSGIRLSVSDANYPTSPEIQYLQYDSSLRRTQVQTPLGSVGYNYSSSNQVGIVASLPSGQADTETLYDGYGRISRIATANGQSSHPWYQTDYCYDAAGNLQFLSSVYQGDGWGTPKQCSGSGVSYTYDALGRVLTMTTPDGTSSYQYAGRATLATDVNGIQKITQADTLGRTSAVCEVSSGNLQGDSPQSCGLDIIGTGYLTTYVYDLANHKTIITQGAQQRIFQTDSLGRTIYTKEPEAGETSYQYTYNSTGLQVTRTKPRANQGDPNTKTNTVMQFDSVGRLVETSYDDGTPNKYFFYDTSANFANFTQTNLKGRLGFVYDLLAGNWAATVFSYDALGRIVGLAECLPSSCGNGAYDKWLSYSYDLAGDLLSASDPAAGTISYPRSVAGEATKVTNQSYSLTGSTGSVDLVSNIQNGPFGPTSWQLANGLTDTNAYGWDGMPSSQWVCVGSSADYCSGGTLTYGFQAYFKGGRLNSACDFGMNQCAIEGYDDMNRLASHSQVFGGSNASFSYSYDRYGNRWHQTLTGGIGPRPSYSFNTSNNQIAGYSYDAPGNMTWDSFHSYTYDADGNITAVDNGNTAQYFYNALNQKVRTQNPGGSVSESVFDPAGRVTSNWSPQGGATDSHIFWDDRQIAFRAQIGTTYFTHRDWVGTDRVHTAPDGTAAARFSSSPFGDNGSITGVTEPQADWDFAHFGGLDYNGETGTYHANFRQYSSTQGRWFSPDPYSGSYDAGDPQSFNRYAYVNNNPLSGDDPLGLEDVDQLPVIKDGVYTFSEYASAPVSQETVVIGGTFRPPSPYQPVPSDESAGGWVPSLVVAAYVGPKLDPQNQECKALAKKISNIVDQITKRQNAITLNPGQLPELPPFPGAPRRLSVQGHRELLDEYRENLVAAANLYNQKCGGGDPFKSLNTSTAPNASSSLPTINPRSLLVGGVVIGGVAAGVGVAILCPECLVVAPLFAP